MQNGITLIALVISIIVMLILAGVSINAVVGDNGIISKSQDATILQSVAMLEEFLNMQCVEYVDDANNFETKLDLLKSKNEDWFYKTAEGYVLDADNHVLYLINKSGLPLEVRNSLKGGDANSISSYYNQQDVYGVTSDLHVYYCLNGIDSIIGLTVDELKKDNPLEVIYDETSYLAKFIYGIDEEGKALGTVSNQTLKTITNLVIDEEEKLQLLSYFSDLSNLNKVYFKNLAIENLDGIEGGKNISEVRFENCQVNNYSKVGLITNLNKLYLILPAGKETDVITLCDNTVGIGSANLSNLQYFAISGLPTKIQSLEVSHDGDDGSDYVGSKRFDITNVDAIANLSDTTKKAVKYLYLNNLKLETLENALIGFDNVNILRIEWNSLYTLKGLENLPNLLYLYAYNQISANFAKDDGEELANPDIDALASLSNLNEIVFLDLYGGTNIKWIRYIQNMKKLENLNLTGCTNIKDMDSIVDIASNLEYNFKYDGSLAKDLISKSSRILNLDASTITVSEFKKLKNNTDIYALKLRKAIIIDDITGQELNDTSFTDLFNNVLSTCTNMKYLDIGYQEHLTNINFVEKMPLLEELYLTECNSVNDISLLENLTISKKIKLNTLCLSNTALQLNTIQTVISNLGSVDFTSNDGILELKEKAFWYSDKGTSVVDSCTGLLLKNIDLFKQLENCTNVTNLIMCKGWRSHEDFSSLNGDLDLRNLRLENVVLYDIKANIILPNTVKNLNIRYGMLPDLSECNNLETMNVWVVSRKSENIKNMINGIPDSITSLRTLGIMEQDTGNSTNDVYIKDFEFLSKFSNCTNMENLIIRQLNSRTNYYLPSLAGIEKLTYVRKISIENNTRAACDAILPNLSNLLNLTDLYIKNGSINIDNIVTCKNLQNLTINEMNITNLNFLNGISTLVNVDLSNNEINNLNNIEKNQNLKKLNLDNNNLIDISPLRGLNNLEELSINNNKLSDFGYDVTGKNYYTLTIFTELNEKGKLRNLQVYGNLIEKFALLTDSGLKWNELILNEDR